MNSSGDKLISATAFKQGEVINGTYLVLSKIAEGGMGAIYKVEHQALKKILALKTVNACAEEKMQQVGWQRFQREAQTISRLTHKSIIQVYDFGMTADAVGFYVMEFIEGKTLAEVVRANGQLPAAKTIAIFLQVAQGLAYAHSQGLVHRDIKPSNIMLSGETISKGECLVKIVDFGLAQFIESSQMPRSANPLEQAELLVGSPPYMSPEQFQNNKIDSRSDIYSFGCALFEALTGVPPFISDSPLVLSMKHCSEPPPRLSQASLGCNFPAELEQMQSLLLAKNPAERYQDMQTVARDLDTILKSGALEQQTGGSAQTKIENQSRPANRYAKAGDSFNQTESVTMSPRPEAKTTKMLLILAPLLIIAVGAVLTMIMGLPPKISLPTSVYPTLKTGVDKNANTTSRDTTSGDTTSADTTSRDTTSADTTSRDTTSANSTSSDSTIRYSKTRNTLTDNIKKPFSTIVSDTAGNKIRLFQFPENINLGRITDRKLEQSPGVLAKGQVAIPAGQECKFTPSIVCCNSPSYFRRFRSDDLYALSVNNNESVTSETLNYIDHLTGLQDLSVLQTSINDDAIAALDELKGLRKLDISNSDISGPALAKLKILNQLVSLRADQIGDISLVLDHLQKSSNLKILHINGCRLRPDDLQKLTKIPKLQELAISNTEINQNDLNVVAKCPALARLIVIGNGFNDDIIPVLGHFKHLKMLRINCDGWRKSEIAALNSAFPGLEIQVQEKY